MSASDGLTDVEAVQIHRTVGQDEQRTLGIHEDTLEQIRNIRSTMNSGLEGVTLSNDDILWLMIDVVKMCDPGTGFDPDDLDEPRLSALDAFLEASMVSRGVDRKEDIMDYGGDSGGED
jgi:hypothetical protein